MANILCGVLIGTVAVMTVFASSASVPLPNAKPAQNQLHNVQGTKNESSVVINSSDEISIITDKTSRSSKPLSPQDKNLYRLVFDLQQEELWSIADQFIEKIDNDVLIGHVLSQRYLNPSYAPSANDLRKWAEDYADHPQSVFIDSKRSTYKSQITGTMTQLRYFSNGSKYISTKYNQSQRYEMRLVRQKIAQYLDRGAITAALSYFKKHRVKRYIDVIDEANILSKIAAHYMYLDRLDKARATALSALKLSKEAPLAGWVAGLTAWIEKDFVAATKYFSNASQATYASPWTVAAASYWGARSAARAGLRREVVPLLGRAIEHQRTFYGLIAMKAMEKSIGSMEFDFDWSMPKLNASHIDTLMKYRVGARVIALIDIGRLSSAQAELYNLPVKGNPQLAIAAIALANHYNLAGYAMRFSSIMTKDNDDYYDAGLFPVSNWTQDVKDGDKALINAFIRQESRFQPRAKNGTGARGLMQVMPGTAAYITGDDNFKTSQGQRLLDYPKINVEIGSNYLNHLTSLDIVDDDLFHLTIAYNAGPGKLARWKKQLKIDDPLLFIELIPASETRAFVERVVTNYWIYQIQMGLTPKTLLDVAQGQWPILKNKKSD